MLEPFFQKYLLVYMVIATWVIIFWSNRRKSRVIRIQNVSNEKIEKIEKFKLLKKVSTLYWVLFSLFGIMIITYTIFPEFYYVFTPIDKAHHPLINTLGFLILKIAMIWIIVVQIKIDRGITTYYTKKGGKDAMDLIWNFEWMLLSGMLVLFIGLITTITNIFGFVLIGAAIYVRYFYSGNFKFNSILPGI